MTQTRSQAEGSGCRVNEVMQKSKHTPAPIMCKYDYAPDPCWNYLGHRDYAEYALMPRWMTSVRVHSHQDVWDITLAFTQDHPSTLAVDPTYHQVLG